MDEKLDGLEIKVSELKSEVGTWQGRWEEERQRNDDLARILTRVVEIGTKGGILSQVDRSGSRFQRSEEGEPPTTNSERKD